MRSSGGGFSLSREAGLVYRMLRYGTQYDSQSLERYEAEMREKQERSLRRRAQSLGFDLVARPPSPS